GGFDAKYGDKMSSVLDIEYKQPKSFEAVASGSLLGANLYLGQASKNGKFTQIHGFRYKTNAYLLGTLDTKGTYKPSFTDYQTYMTWKLTPTTELSFLGNYSRNSYQFAPDSSSTAFGTFQQKYNLNIYFDGQEKDLFETSFGSLKLKKRLSDAVQLNLQSSVFRTDEDENYDITGQYYLSSTPIKNNQEDKDNETLIGVGTYHEHARNHLEASVFNITHYGEWKLDGHTGQWGVGYQKEIIHDKLREWEMRDSAGYALPYSDSQIKLVYNMRSKVDMISNRLTGYLQDTWRFRKSPGLFVVTGGVRGNYWDYNQETLISPRASIAFMPAWKKDFTFRLASGFYYQTPFYKELRDTATINGVTQIVLNQHIKAQKTIHYVAGMDYHFIWVDRPFKLTTELYYKDMSNLIPYTVDNVRIRYYGRNMADGYTAGLDMKLFGEFVPGTDSWISLSLMKSQETIDGVTVPRPNEQRYNVSVFFQDYFPSDPRFTMNLKLIWADGLPFGPPNEGRSFATLRMPPYRRIDIGLSRVFSPDQDVFMRKSALKWVKNLWIGVDCFNLLSTNNVNSYYWVTDIDNRQWAVPNYLTGRLLNFRFTAEF
ncbi:MAG: TonB-dependent receptor, partial [Bacteroidota bacterium]|nr:TonB-dependent receptor [Bacteroidota bacterium]